MSHHFVLIWCSPDHTLPASTPVNQTFHSKITHEKIQSSSLLNGKAGIGLAYASKFSEAGSDLSIFSHQQAENEAAQKLVGQQGVRCIMYAGDLANAANVTAALEQTCKQVGGINNAGIEQHDTPRAAQTEDDYQRIIDTNVKGVWRCMWQQIPRMLEAGVIPL